MFLQSLEFVLSYLLYSPVGDMIMTLVTLIGSSPMSLFIFTVLCVIGFIAGICMILYAVCLIMLYNIIKERQGKDFK